MLEVAGRKALQGALSGDLRLLSGDAQIDRAGSRPVSFGRSQTVRFGPAVGQDWRVTGVAIYRGNARLLTQPFDEPQLIRRGQSLALDIDIDVSD